MTDHEPDQATVLVVSDDAELGGLIALNLRLRGFVVEHTDISLAQSCRWEPAFGPPDLLILDLESPERVSPTHLRHLGERAWARETPILLATEGPNALVGVLRPSPRAIVARCNDVGGIVAAARALLNIPDHPDESVILTP